MMKPKENTRPAASVERLETIGYVHRGTAGLLMEGAVSEAVIIPKAGGDFKHAVVFSEQAEEVISAERMKLEASAKVGLQLSEQIEALEADNTAKDARIAELEDERYKLALAITGGEDAPGYLNSLTVETLVNVALDHTHRWFAETDRAEALEADNAAKNAEIADLKKLISSTHKNAVKHTECEAVNCPICDGGLFVCADCGAAEIETEQKICTGSMAALETDNKRLREALKTEKALADRLASALEYIDDYSLSYPDLGTVTAVAQPALKEHSAARAALDERP